MWPAEPGSVACGPRRSSLSFFPVFDPATWTGCFSVGSLSVVVVILTCCFGLRVIFILMPALPFRPDDLLRWCSELHSELHGQFCTLPKLRSCCGHLIRCKTAANQKGIETQLQTRFRHFPHRLSREVGHGNIAPFVNSNSHRRRLVFCALRNGPGGLGWGQVRLSSKISWSE